MALMRMGRPSNTGGIGIGVGVGVGIAVELTMAAGMLLTQLSNGSWVEPTSCLVIHHAREIEAREIFWSG